MPNSLADMISILLFCHAGDSIECVGIGPSDQACHFCGNNAADFAHVMKNPRTGRKLIACPSCVRQCGEATGEPVVYPRKHERLVARINEKWPGRAVVAAEERKVSQHWSDVDFQEIVKEVMPTASFEERTQAYVADWAPEGLDPTEVDWEAYDYEA